MAGFDLLNIGNQALLANRSALATVGQNISNASTEGYSRQTSNFLSIDQRGGSYIQSVTRSTDSFLTTQLWSEIASYQATDVQSSYLNQSNNLLSSDATSVSKALDNYFKAMQNVVDDPTSLPNRELFIEEVSTLTRRFNDLQKNLSVQNDKVNSDIKTSVQNISSLAQSVADFNKEIVEAEGKGINTNELRDKRDEAVKSIAEYIDVRVVEQGNSYNLFVGNGQPIVTNDLANDLVAVPGDPDTSQSEIRLTVGQNSINVTGNLSGGKLGGALEFRENELNKAQNELGRIAIAVAESMNNQHKLGLDLDNNIGGDIFVDVNRDDRQRARISAASDNGSTINVARVQIVDTKKLTDADYELVINDTNQIVLQHTDGTRVPLTKVANDADVDVDGEYYINQSTGDLHVKVDGIDITIDGTTSFAVGDEFLIQPTRNGAADLEQVINNPRQLALASPVKVTTGVDNKGTAVASVNVTDGAHTAFSNSKTTGKLNPPIQIVFDNNTPPRYSVFNIDNPNSPVAISTNQTYTSGAKIDLGGYEVEIKNVPKPGDRFTFNFNKDGVSDNRNALKLSALQTTDTTAEGSYQDSYSTLIERVGAVTAKTNINLAANKAVMESTQESRAAIMGVNLDEEAARLVQFQQAYQASAQIISTSQRLFDTLLQSF